MARTGAVLTRPRGDRLAFVTTSADTDGDLLEMDVTYPPRTEALALHLHPHQEETFRVLPGTLRTVIGGEARRYGPGEAFVVPPGTRDADEAGR